MECSMARSASRIQRVVRRTGDGLAAMMTAAAGLSLFAFVVCLEVIGPPPRWRIDALWVHGHSRAVRLMAAALAIAITATIAVFLLRSSKRRSARSKFVLMWIGIAVICTMVYWDRLPIIYNVAMKYAW